MSSLIRSADHITVLPNITYTSSQPRSVTPAPTLWSITRATHPRLPFTPICPLIVFRCIQIFRFFLTFCSIYFYWKIIRSNLGRFNVNFLWLLIDFHNFKITLKSISCCYEYNQRSYTANSSLTMKWQNLILRSI